MLLDSKFIDVVSGRPVSARILEGFAAYAFFCRYIGVLQQKNFQTTVSQYGLLFETRLTSLMQGVAGDPYGGKQVIVRRHATGTPAAP